MATTYLQRTNTSGTSTQKGTISVWIKSGEEPSGNNQTTLASWGDANNHGAILWNGSNRIDAFDYQSGGIVGQLQTNALLRDCSGWYHIVYSWDTTLSTANDRQKVYINGVEQTYSTRTNYSQNAATSWNANSYSVRVGGLNSSSYFSGLMSYVAFVDGTQELPTIFGETDTTTGQWKIKTDITPSVAWGTNGFLILKNGNSLTDESTNSNNFTLGGGTLTNTKDCPDNVFSTLNPLIGASNQPTFTNGNTTVISPSGTNARYGGTLGMTSGKYYYEVKLLGSISNGGFGAGILNIDSFNFNTTSGISTSSNYIGVVVNSLGGTNNFYIQHGGATNDFSQTLSVGMIIGHAIDMDNGYYYVHNNGVYINSGDPTSGATGTGNINRTGNLNYDFSNLTMAIGGTSQNVDYGSFNFGNGTFGTTAVTSAGTNASGIGIFEYDVPTGYTALSTKGLNL